MAEATVEQEYGSWSVPEQPIRVEYALNALTEIDRAVVEGFNRLRHGGVEVGGVLFGARDAGVVRIADFRAVACEHALGPGFVLSRRDEAALAGLLESAKSDPALQGLIPVGWYHSHTRSHIHLTRQDLEVYNAYFPEAWQVALVFRPDHVQPTKAGFFFREEDGRIQAERSYREFSLASLHNVGQIKTDRQRLAERAVRSSGPAISPPAAILRDFPRVSPVKATGWSLAPLGILALSAVAIVGGWMAIQERLEPRREVPVKAAEPSIEPLSLTLEDQGGVLRIGWNRDAAPVRASESATLEITEDGLTSVLDLDAEQLHSGTIVYNRTFENVAVSLKAGGAEESAVFVGRPPADPIAEDTPPEPAPSPKAEPRESAADRADSIPPKRVVRKALLPPAPSRPAPAAISLPMPQVDRITPAAPVSAAWIGSLPSVPSGAAPGATSGRMIWTGMLPKSGVLSIDGNRASAGALTGAIPGQPVRISVYPAELTKTGLAVYSSDSKHAAGSSEAPAAHNGWNQTSYFQEPRLAHAVKIIETPNPKNNWKRLVLRGETVKLSVILIEWEKL